MQTTSAVPESRTGWSRAEWSPLTFWIFQIAFWLYSALALVILITWVTPVKNPTAVIAGRVAIGFLITWGLHHLYQRSAVRQTEGLRKWAAIAGLSLLALLVSSALWLLVAQVGGLKAVDRDNFLSDLFFSRALALVCWHSMYFGIDLWQRTLSLRQAALQANLEARQGELNMLQAQLNPHFLFNALNTIKAAADNPELTRDVTQNLAEYLRFSLKEVRTFEPLSRELDALGLYFAVQRARFGDGLDCRMNIDPATLDAHVPPMLLQPLLENAFKFGGETSDGPLRIEVTATIADTRIKLKVANSGRWVDRPEGLPSGIGLTNLRRRLELLYPGEASLATRSEGNRVEVMIELPVGTEVPTGTARA
jgi:hypothetical protein